MRPAHSALYPIPALLAAAAVCLSPLMTRSLTGMPERGVAAAAVEAEQWIHVRVEEPGPDGELVRINLPLRLAEQILPLLTSDHLTHGRLRAHGGSHLRMDDRELTADELREIWQTVRTSPEGEFLSVQGRKDDVRVARQGGNLVVKASEGTQTDVEIRIPTLVLDALFSGKNSDELDLVAALRALAHSGGLELVAVDDDAGRVRIWVDSRHDSD